LLRDFQTGARDGLMMAQWFTAFFVLAMHN
jgi:hypothetical protein